MPFTRWRIDTVALFKYRERRVDDTAISLAEKIVDTEIENVYSTPKQQNISHRHNEKFRQKPSGGFLYESRRCYKS